MEKRDTEWLLSFIKRKVRDQAEAEDIYQDVLEEFLESVDLGKAIESVSAWLVTVAQNKILDRFRRKKTQNDYRDSKLMETSSLSESIDRPDEEWSRKWIREQIIEALELLPAEQREVFIQHELEGKSFEEIADESGIPINTLLSRKRYAVIFLRGYLKEVYDELE